MAHQSDLIASDILAYLKSQEEKSMLRFITCGSVDDGKSTLIGRLLWDSKMIFEDQLAALEVDSRRVGTQGENIDYALLLDGLQAEREQGITIDVAYRFFSTDKRKFIVADTPGHEQYTRNMVTGASTAQVAVILIDARKGILTQTRRHSYLVSLVGIRHVVLAINKMDLVDYSAARFEEIRREYEAFAAGLGFDQVAAIPISALNGDNILTRSPHTPWHQGPTLMDYLEGVQVADAAAQKPFRMRVQWVNRPNLDFRGFCGTIASGIIHPGDEVVITTSGRKTRIDRIVTMDGDLPRAAAGQAVTLTLTDEIDISRGDVLATPENLPYCAERLEAKVVWLHEEPLQPGRGYLLKAGSSTAPAQVAELKFKVNVNTLQQETGTTLQLNEIGVCSITLDKAITFDSYRENRGTGNFILIDRLSNATVAAGMIHQPMLHPGGIPWQSIELDRQARADLKGQRPRLLWFTGPAGSPALAALVEKKLHQLGRHTYLLDGAELHRRLGLAGGPVEQVRRTAEIARLFVDAGLIVLTSGNLDGQDLLEGFAAENCQEIFVRQQDQSGSLPGQAPGKAALVFDRAAMANDELAEHIIKNLFT
jgi:bifunctional enzyme CysN/CysC